MSLYSERDAVSILDAATDPEGDPLTVSRINGSPAFVGAPVPLSVGGSITVTAQGNVTFNDTGFVWPAQGGALFDSVIATIWDGTNAVDVAVNIQLNHP